MPVENIRLSQKARYQLGVLTGRTKINQRNVLLRWAFCKSIAEPGKPSPARIPLDPDMVPIRWDTFAGDYGDILWALLRMHARTAGLPLDEDTLAAQFCLHLHRGIGYLIGDPRVTDIAGLVSLALGEEEEQAE